MSAVATSPNPPSEPTLIFDGDCSFCQKWVARFKRWDRRDAVRTLRLQDESAAALSARSVSDLRQAMHLVLPDGRVFAGAGAARELSHFIPVVPGVAYRTMMLIPGAMPIANKVYSLVAGNRYKLGCEGGHCTIGNATPGDGRSEEERDGAA